MKLEKLQKRDESEEYGIPEMENDHLKNSSEKIKMQLND
jgi:hypothetical protein